MMLANDDMPWEARIFAKIESGIDGSLIDERLRLTPTERLESMRQVLEFVEDVRRANRDRLP
jgi:hypothetical protein